MRNRRGSSICEFGAAIILFCCLLVPLIGFLTAPIRYAVGVSVVRDLTQRLARVEKRSDVSEVLKEEWYRNFTRACGVNFVSTEVSIDCRNTTAELRVQAMDPVPSEYLDDLSARCELQLDVKAELDPFIPGGNSIPVQFTQCAYWEHMGTDSATGEGFINE